MSAAKAWVEWLSRRWANLPEGHRKRLIMEARKELERTLKEETGHGEMQSEDGGLQPSVRLSQAS